MDSSDFIHDIPKAENRIRQMLKLSDITTLDALRAFLTVFPIINTANMVLCEGDPNKLTETLLKAGYDNSDIPKIMGHISCAVGMYASLAEAFDEAD